MDTTSENFKRDVIESSHKQPVLVDFWAPWCAPCRVLGPLLEKLAAAADGRFVLVKVNTEAEMPLATEYKISGIPDVKLFIDGVVTAEFQGVMPEGRLSAWLDEHVPSATKEAVAMAKTLLAKGDTPRAQGLLREVVKLTPSDFEARALLGQSLFATAAEEAVATVAPIREGDPFYENAQALRTLQRLLTLDKAEMNQQSPSWPAYHRGIEALVKRDYDAALDAWIEALRRDRKLDEDGARRACVALFHVLGDDHEATRSHRRAFSSALF